MYASPFHFALLAGDRSDASLSTLRLAVSTTTGLPESVQQRFYDRYGFHVSQAYGIIELGLVCVNVDRPFDRQRSVGKVLPDYQISIRNTSDYRSATGDCGDIYFKGPGFFDGYFSPLRKAEDVMEDGWFDTGDIGQIDDNGYVHLIGRKKELVNVAGMKVFPQEVEAAIDLHPQVKESRVYGVTDVYAGEVVAADVVMDPGAGSSLTTGDLAVHCKQRLAAYKIPNQFNFVDSIPKTAVTAKIVRV
jgi:acyl-coenzyme A synthetase/AMP-(fatty) acid ligase